MLNTVIEGAFKWAYSHACKYRFLLYLPLLIQTSPSFLNGKPVCICSTQNQFSEEDKFPMSYILILNSQNLKSENQKKYQQLSQCDSQVELPPTLFPTLQGFR